MIFQADMTIPANTTQGSPTKLKLKIAHGIISQIEVQIPSGHKALAHLTIFHGSHQIAPSTQDMDIHGDTFPVKWSEFYEMYQPPYELTLVGWNTDEEYPHTFPVYIAIIPRKAIVALAITDVFKTIITKVNPKRMFTRR